MLKTKLAAQNAARLTPVPVVVETTKIERGEQKKMGAQERQRIASLKKPLAVKLAKLENEISALTKKQEEIESALADETIYDASRKDDLKKLLDAQVRNKQLLEKIESEWLKLTDELDQLQTE
jgi:ATP-binding cassette subfamily F protein 3